MKTIIIFFLICSVCFAGEIVESKNLSGKQLSGFYDVTFKNCNFMQKEPFTTVFTDSSKLTFISSNLSNCVMPKDSIIIDCNTAQIKKTFIETKEIKTRRIEQFDTDGRGYTNEKINDNTVYIDVYSYTPVTR